MRRIEIAKILRNESDLLAKYFLSNPSEISNFNKSYRKFLKHIKFKCLSWQYQNLSDISIAYHKHLNGSQNICLKYLIIEPLDFKEQERDS